MCSIACMGDITFSPCSSRCPSCCLSRADTDSPTKQAALAIGQHAVRAGESIPVPTWTCPHSGESIPVQLWTGPQGGQVHYTDAAAGLQMTAGKL